MKTFEQYVVEQWDAKWQQNMPRMIAQRAKRAASELEELATSVNTWTQHNPNQYQGVEQKIKSMAQYVQQLSAAAGKTSNPQSNPQQGQNMGRPAAAPVQLQGLKPEIAQQLQNFPKLSQAISQIGRYKDVAEPLKDMLNVNAKRFPVWEKQIESGQLDAQGLKNKLVHHGFYNPLSYPRY